MSRPSRSGKLLKVVILAGGLGTRLSEETRTRRKPMVEIGGRPILWHLMNLYPSGGFDDFVVAVGYKQEVVKDYFRSLHSTNNDISIDFSTGDTIVRERSKLSWKISSITGAGHDGRPDQTATRDRRRPHVHVYLR